MVLTTHSQIFRSVFDSTYSSLFPYALLCVSLSCIHGVHCASSDLQAKERLIEDMRLALTEQEDTQTQQEQVLEAKLEEIDALTEEVEKVKGLLRYQDNRKDTAALTDGQSDEAKLAKQEAVQAQVTLKLCTEKHQADRRKWLEEKMVLIRQAKEAEDKRNQEMRKFADGRERHAKQQTQVEDLVAQLGEKEQDLVKWRKERDSLVTALEVQLTKLVSNIADKDEQIASLRCNASSQPAERHHGQVEVEELQSLLSERDAEILKLKEQLMAVAKASGNVSSAPPTKPRETATLTKAEECPPQVSERTLHDDNSELVHGVKTEKRTSRVTSCLSRHAGFPTHNVSHALTRLSVRNRTSVWHRGSTLSPYPPCCPPPPEW
ncbi:unnamed protein product [Oncorhynchus mykiss]|uniref:Uncharacterized protein n=1 Tax=Oncorhynchus mykiss TaxID=8022 RepID=A0A060Y839_ONCMY|nr:unnamed protein product [Oncorhynchus mykiss]